MVFFTGSAQKVLSMELVPPNSKKTTKYTGSAKGYHCHAKAKKDLSPRCLQEELVRAKSKLIEAVMEAKQKSKS